jgi:2'-5' RNA ligase
MVDIVLRLDDATASKIGPLIEALPDRCPGRPPRHLAHITLASYANTVDVSDLDAALATATGRWKRLPITLAGFGVFHGESSTLWLAPAPTADLLSMHTTLLRALADLPVHPLYEVGAWVPHVTLAETKFPPDAIEVLATMWNGPITGWAESLDLMCLDPFGVLSSRPLRD